MTDIIIPLSPIIIIGIIFLFLHVITIKRRNTANIIFKILKQLLSLSKKGSTLEGKIENIPITIEYHKTSATIWIQASNYLTKDLKKIFPYTKKGKFKNDFIKAIWTPELLKKTTDLKKAIDLNNCEFSLKRDKLVLIYYSHSVLKGKIYDNNFLTENCKLLTKHIKQLIIICQEIKNIPEIKERLINNIKNFRSAKKRISSLKALLKFYPNNLKESIFLKQLLLDKNITIRVLAALYLKNKPELYLSELLKNKIATTDLFYILDYCKNTNFKESAKFLKNLLKRKNCITIEEKAISTLLSFNSKENDIFLINHQETDIFLKTKNILLIIEKIKKRSYKETIPAFITLFKKTVNYHIKKAIYTAFTELKEKTANTFLIQQLKKNKNPSFELLNAIAACGNKDSIEPLYILNKKTKNSRLKTKLQDTIAKIQSRLGSAEKGWVSISKTDVKQGGLSEAKEDKQGALSKTKSKPKKKKKQK